MVIVILVVSLIFTGVTAGKINHSAKEANTKLVECRESNLVLRFEAALDKHRSPDAPKLKIVTLDPALRGREF